MLGGHQIYATGQGSALLRIGLSQACLVCGMVHRTCPQSYSDKCLKKYIHRICLMQHQTLHLEKLQTKHEGMYGIAPDTTPDKVLREVYRLHIQVVYSSIVSDKAPIKTPNTSTVTYSLKYQTMKLRHQACSMRLRCFCLCGSILSNLGMGRQCQWI